MVQFKDYNIRVWGNYDIDISSDDLLCFISSTHYGIQINSIDETKQEEITKICCKIHEDFKILTEKLKNI